jgi:hypothetical protein
VALGKSSLSPGPKRSGIPSPGLTTRSLLSGDDRCCRPPGVAGSAGRGAVPWCAITAPPDRAALGNAQDGILLGGDITSNATIGGTTAAARNVISGNGFAPAFGISYAGVRLSENGGTNNLIEGNFIGTDATGLSRLPNYIGIQIGNSIGPTRGHCPPAAVSVLRPGARPGLQLPDLRRGGAHRGSRSAAGTRGTGSGIVPAGATTLRNRLSYTIRLVLSGGTGGGAMRWDRHTDSLNRTMNQCGRLET